MKHRPFTVSFAVMAAWLLLLVSPWMSARVYGAETVDVKTLVSASRVIVGDSLTYSITMTSDTSQIANEQVHFVEAPQFRGLRMASKAPSRELQQSWVNGKVSMQLVLTWRLTAEQEGTAEVTAGKIQLQGKTYSLEPHTIKVDLPSAPASGIKHLHGRPLLPARTENTSINKQLEGRLFTTLEADTTSPYLQESFELKCVLYIDSLELAGQISSPEWILPEWDGFFAEELPVRELRLESVKVGEQSYHCVTIGRVRLTPVRGGDLRIPLTEAQARLKVQSSRRSFEDRFFDFGFGGLPGFGFDTIPVRMPMAPMELSVRALPTEDRPASFRNGVGRFTIAAHVDQEEMTQDDFLTLRFEIGGEGFLGSIGAPVLPEMEDWRLVAEPEMKIKQAGSDGPAKKTFEFMLRAERSGLLTIPEISYAFFDPEAEAYIEKVLGPFDVQVEKGEDRPLLVAAAPNGAARAGLTGPEDDMDAPIAYIRPEPPVSLSASTAFQRSPIFVLLMSAAPAFFLLGAGVRWVRDYRELHSDRLRRRSALTRAQRDLQKVAGAEKSQGSREAAGILAGAIRGYLSNRFDRAASGLTLEQIEDLAVAQGATSEVGERLRSIVEWCDQVEYLPDAKRDVSLSAMGAETLEILADLDRRSAS